MSQVTQLEEAAAEEYVPSVQFVQLAAPAAEYVPAAQSAHVSIEVAAVAAEYLPAAHAVRVAVFGQ